MNEPHLVRRVTVNQTRMIVRLIGGTLVLFVLWRGRLMFGVQSVAKGVEGGRLAECPSSPNCVCSQSADTPHHIEPLSYDFSPEKAWEKLITVLRSQPRTKIILQESRYLHVEFTTPLMRFVDDVEFLRDDAASVIHVRSASRVGYSDLGANRSRVEKIRKLYEEALDGG